MITLRVLGLLLTYPTEDLLEALPDMKKVLEEEKHLGPSSGGRLSSFFETFGHKDLLDLQEDYVRLFDQTSSLSLHLFEHVHGESKERGAALSDLLSIYKEAGLILGDDEMPDYLPVFLEYLSSLPEEGAKEHLGSIAIIISALCKRLKKRESMYAEVLQALLSLSPYLPPQDHTKEAEAVPLDTLWEEKPVF